MLKTAKGFHHIYIACGYTDLRRGIDSLAYTVRQQFNLDPFDEGSIFLFCGRRSDRIKALIYEGDGFCLLYKRLSDGHFQWPRNQQEVQEITHAQYQALMDGFEVIRRQTIRSIKPEIL